MLFINEKESCQCTITFMVSAANVFETTWSQENENEVDLMKWVLSHAYGNTTRDIREEKARILTDGLGNSLATYGSWPRNNSLHLRLRQSHSFRPPFVRMDCDEWQNNPVAFTCWVHNCDDLSFAKNVIPQFKYMNFIYSLHIELTLYRHGNILSHTAWSNVYDWGRLHNLYAW